MGSGNLEKDQYLLEKRFIELSRNAYQRDFITYSDFLNLNEQNILHTLPKENLFTQILTFGGYGMAERQMAAFIPDALYLRCGKKELDPALIRYPFKALQVLPLNRKFSEDLTHRDYLGSILNLGIDRSKTGDILIENNTDILSIHNDIQLNVKRVISNFKAIHMDGSVSTKVYYIFVPDFDEVAEKLAQYNLARYMTYYGCNLDGSDDAEMAAEGVLNNKFAALDASQQEGINYVRCESYAFNKESFYGAFGGLLVLGILLGIVFAFAAILIMYYKQVTEGYEDQSGFVVMQKVGMTKKDIRQSINSQILIVFFAPLLLAGLHLLFAFPMISKLLLLFGLNRTQFLAMVALGCYLMFAVFYIIVYKMTSGVYYRMVSVNNK